jgi:Zn-dependent protease with chaperone function
VPAGATERQVSDTPRLNPFAFPADTTVRLVFLAILIVVATVQLAIDLMFVLATDAPSDLCLQRLSETGSVRPWDLKNGAASEQTRDISSACPLGGSRLVAALLLSVGGVALIIFLLHPRLAMWKRRLQPLPPALGATIAARVEALGRGLGVICTPVIWWAPLDCRIDGSVFGRTGRPHLALAGGTVAASLSLPREFDGVVCHELAHLANRDVTKTGVTMALWYAFVAGAVLPYFVLSLWYHDEWSSMLESAARLLLLSLVVLLTRNAVLRTRERYADLRAALVPGMETPLRALFAKPSRIETPSWWRRLWRVHPTPAARSKGLHDVDDLFRPPFWEAMVVGFCIGYGAAAAVSLATLAAVDLGVTPDRAPTSDDMLNDLLLVVWLLGPTICLAMLSLGALGVAVCRVTVAEAFLGRRRGAVLRPALGAAAGIVLSFVAPAGGREYFGELLPMSTLEVAALGSIHAAAFLIYTVVLVLFFGWFRAMAQTWLGPMLAAHSPKPYIAVVLIGGALPLALVLPIALFAHSTSAISVELIRSADSLIGLPWALAKGMLSMLLFDPLCLPAIFVIWALPLTGALLRQPVGERLPDWLLLEPCEQLRVQPTRRPFHPLAIAAGVVLATFAYRLAFDWNTMTQLAQQSEARGTAIMIIWFGVAALLQGGAALIAALMAPSLTVAHGVCAAFLAGSGMILLLGIDAGVLPVALLKITLTLTLGFIAALIACGLAVVVRSVLARLRRATA